MQFGCKLDPILMQLDALKMEFRCKFQMQNLDAIVTESEMHIITSKLDQNINQKPDQQINN